MKDKILLIVKTIGESVSLTIKTLFVALFAIVPILLIFGQASSFILFPIYMSVSIFIYLYFIKPRLKNNNRFKNLAIKSLTIFCFIILLFIEPIILNIIAQFYALKVPDIEVADIKYPISVYAKSSDYYRFPDGKYIIKSAKYEKDGKIRVVSCVNAGNIDTNNLDKECKRETEFYTKDTMPQMDYIMEKRIENNYFVEIIDYILADKDGKILSVDRKVYPNYKCKLVICDNYRTTLAIKHKGTFKNLNNNIKEKKWQQ